MDTHGSIFLYRAAAMLSFLTLALYLAVTLAYNGTGSLRPYAVEKVKTASSSSSSSSSAAITTTSATSSTSASSSASAAASSSQRHSRGVSLPTLQAAPSSLIAT